MRRRHLAWLAFTASASAALRSYAELEDGSSPVLLPAAESRRRRPHYSQARAKGATPAASPEPPANSSADALSTSRYVITFASLEKRFDTLPEVLQTLLDQTIPPFRIFVNVQKAPPSLRNFTDERVVIKIVEDIGPFTKVYYTLTDGNLKPDIPVLVTDDDALRGPDWAEGMLRALDETRSIGHGRLDAVVSYASIVFGGYGYGLRRNLWDTERLTQFFHKLPNSTWSIDDDFLTLFCVVHETPIRNVCRDERGSTLPDADSGLNSRGDRNDLRQTLQDYAMEAYGIDFSLAVPTGFGHRIRNLFAETPRVQTEKRYNATWPWFDEDCFVLTDAEVE